MNVTLLYKKNNWGFCTTFQSTGKQKMYSLLVSHWWVNYVGIDFDCSWSSWTCSIFWNCKPVSLIPSCHSHVNTAEADLTTFTRVQQEADKSRLIFTSCRHIFSRQTTPLTRTAVILSDFSCRYHRLSVLCSWPLNHHISNFINTRSIPTVYRLRKCTEIRIKSHSRVVHFWNV